MPKAVLWDIGNVVVRWDPRTLYAKIFKEPADLDRFLSHVCTMTWHVNHDLGVTFEENRKPLLAQSPNMPPRSRPGRRAGGKCSRA